jgi:hypothetical protein
MLEGIEKHGNIRLASQTIDIVDFPELKFSRNNGGDKR